METDPSPVRLWSAAESEGHSEGYWTAYEHPSESEEMARPPTRANCPRTQPGASSGAWSAAPLPVAGPSSLAAACSIFVPRAV